MSNAAEKLASNPMIEGVWQPQHNEIDTVCTDIEGQIPADLAGSYFRNGPNQQFDPMDPKRYHFFDGDGMIHQVELIDGKAHYRNRWVETKCLKLEREQGKSLWRGFKAPPDFQHPTGIAMKHPANTHVIYHNGKLMALWEAGLPYEMDINTLETVGEMNFDGKWPHAFTAHPTIDPHNGDLVTFYYSILARPHLKYGVINKHGEVVHNIGIDLPKPVMIHDLAITRNYSIITDLPYVFSLERAMKGKYPFEWEPDNGARIGILPRYGQAEEIRWFTVDIGYIQHIFNAYEDGDEVVYHVCRSRKTSLVTSDEYNCEEEQAQPYEYRFNLKTGEHTERLIENVHVEFSRINDDYTGVKYRYGYACRFKRQAEPEFDAIMKFDFDRGTSETWELEPGWTTGECVFAPRIDAQGEDDGYCIAMISDQTGRKSELVILDAQAISKGPIARITIPQRVPNGFHANWIPAKDYR